MKSEPLGARYLTDPRRLPGRGEGELFGNRQVEMAIAGTRLLISGLSPSQEETIWALWPEFIGESEASPIPLTVYKTPQSTFKKLDRWVYELDFAYEPSSVRMVGLDLIARLVLEPSLSAELWTATELPETFHGAFENFLRVVVAYTSLRRGGLLVHSAAVTDGNDAWLFIGHSGAGKSTVSRLALDSDRHVLSDDLNPVLPRGVSEIDVAGSPFLGDYGNRSATSRPLSAVYRLEQGNEDALSPMGTAETFASLMACAPYINRDRYRADVLAANLTTLSRRVPARILTFRRDGDFWSLLEKGALA